jgi:hypothetical protein
VLKEFYVAIKAFKDNISSDGMQNLLENQCVSAVIQKFIEFLSYLHADHGKLATFWMSFVDLVDILLGLIRASREGNWLLHLASIREFIPWCFAYDKQNYARYTSVYYGQMSQLADTHPKVSIIYKTYYVLYYNILLHVTIITGIQAYARRRILCSAYRPQCIWQDPSRSYH